MVDVVAADDLPEEPDAEAAGPSSPLALLKGKRAELEKKLHLDLAVPRWDEVLGRRLWVRYRPADPTVFANSVEKREREHAADVKKGGPGDRQRLVRANADMLVAACIAVYDLPLDEEPGDDLTGLDQCPTFSSPELSEAVGASASAVDTCRKVYATDADLMIAADSLLEWSGERSKKAHDDFLAG